MWAPHAITVNLIDRLRELDNLPAYLEVPRRAQSTAPGMLRRMQDVPRDSSRLPGQRSGTCVRTGQSHRFQALLLAVHRSERKGIRLSAHSLCLLPCRRSDGDYRQRTVTPAEHTEDFRPTYQQTRAKPARPHHRREDLLVAECVVGSWCMPTPLTGEKEPKSRTSPELALTLLGYYRGVFLREVYPAPPGKMAQKNSAGFDCITPAALCQGSRSLDTTLLSACATANPSAIPSCPDKLARQAQIAYTVEALRHRSKRHSTSRCGGTVYAAVSKTAPGNGLWVRIPPPAPSTKPLDFGVCSEFATYSLSPVQPRTGVLTPTLTPPDANSCA